MGYMYCEYVHERRKGLLIWIVMLLMFYAIFPFDAYRIHAVNAIDVGLSFIICSIVLRAIYECTWLNHLFQLFGKHSLYIWLFHMPINLGYGWMGLPKNALVTFSVVFVLSLLVSMLITACLEKMHQKILFKD